MKTTRLPDSKYLWGFFFLLLLTALFTNLGVISLQFEEPRRALVAIEMDLTGEYIVPKINGHEYYNKPPIFNWLLIALTKLFNSRENWVYRIPTVVSLLLIALVNYQITRKKVEKSIAIFSSLLLLTSGNILFYFSFMGEIDMFYSLIVYLQILVLLHFFQKKKYAALFLLSYFLTALGVLTKGLPSLAFQAITILSLFIYHKRYRQLFSLWNFLGLFIMVGVLWGYFSLYQQKGDALPYITRLISESSRRTLTNKHWLESLSHLFKFPLLIFSMIAPWGLMVPIKSLKAAWKKLLENEWLHLSMIFLIPNLLLYWLSSGTLDRYLYMFLPFILVMVCFLYNQSSQKYFQWTGPILYLLGIVLVFLIPGYAYELPFYQGLAVSAILGITSLLALYIHWKAPEYRVFILICFLLGARLLYNFLTMPIRSLHRPPFHEFVEKLVEHDVTGIRSIESVEETYNPFTRENVPIKKIEHPPYQLSFYYAKRTGKILNYSKLEYGGETYIKKMSFYQESVYHTLLDTIDIKHGNNKGKYLIYKVSED